MSINLRAIKMFEYLRKMFSMQETPREMNPVKDSNYDAEGKKLKAAACTLFVEMAKADDNFSETERDKIISIMKSTFDLEDECINELILQAEKRMESDENLYDLTKLINQNFSNNQKFELLKNLWRLIYIDKKLDMYEDHLIKKIGGLINMGHEDIIGAKMLVKTELGN
jgi:uncharacterized tellurite resistance protein B-like protein